MSTIISAVAIADIVFFVLLALGLVIGLIGGVARAFKGFFAAVFIVLLSLLLVGGTLNSMCALPASKSMSSKIEQSTADWGAVFTEPVYIAQDGSYYIWTEYNGEKQMLQLENAGGSGLVNKSKAELALRLAKRFITQENEGASLSRIASDAITSIIVAILAFIGFCIGFWLVFFIIRRIFKHIHNGDSAALGAIDRLLGCLVAAFMVLTFMLLVLAILKACNISGVNSHFAESHVAGYLYNHNPISTIFSRVFG